MHVCMIGMLVRFVYEGSVDISLCLESSASRLACSQKYLHASNVFDLFGAGTEVVTQRNNLSAQRTHSYLCLGCRTVTMP